MGSTLTNLLFHVVFSTKHRAPIIIQNLRNELFKYMNGIVKGEGGTLLAIGGTEDHVHCLIKLKPRHPLSEIIKKLKANSSKWANANNKIEGRFAWQSGYAAYSVSQSQLPLVIGYIAKQEKHHRRRPFKEEYVSLLNKHGVTFDKDYLWN
jgi:REP element-mobilizing transposase RayT